MNKKKLLIVGVVVVVIALIVLGYFLFIKNPSPNIPGSDENPFGNPGNSNSNPTLGGSAVENGGNGPTTSSNGEIAVLWKISENPVSGATIRTTGSTSVIRFVEKATGHVYEQNPETKAVRRISNSTIPKTERIIWGANANALLFQYETGGIIKTFYARIASSSASSTEQGLVGGKYLTDNMSEAASSPLGDKLFSSFVIPDAGALMTINFDGSGGSNIMTSRVSEWITAWPKDNILTATTKASAFVPGYLYFIDPKNKIFEKVIGNIAGLTTLTSKTGNEILYSRSVPNNFILNFLDIKNNLETVVSPQTFPEKCVWGTLKAVVFYCGVPREIPAGEYPDVWYQGRVSFSDNIWLYDASTGATELLLDLFAESGETIDVIDPIINTNGSILVFRNKKDFSLWGMRVDPTRFPLLTD